MTGKNNIPKLPNPARLFHAGDPLWAKLGKPIGGSENDPYPDRWKSRDLSNGVKIGLGVGVIVGGTLLGGPIGTAIGVGCVTLGAGVGFANSHFRQRRLDNLQSFAGEINARTRYLVNECEAEAGHDQHHCSDEITHGVLQSAKDKKWRFLGIFTTRQTTNAVSATRVAASTTLSTGKDSGEVLLGALIGGIGVINDTAIATIDGARAGYYTYHINNEEYQKYIDAVEKRDEELDENSKYYSGKHAFDMIKKIITDNNNLPQSVTDIINKSHDINGFLEEAIKQQKKYGKDTFPVTALAFVIDNFALITESKKDSIQESKVEEFLKKSYDEFQVKERWGPRSRVLPYRNDVVHAKKEDKKWHEISLRSWQVNHRIEFDKNKIKNLESKYSCQGDGEKLKKLKEGVEKIIDPGLKKSRLGILQYKNIYNILLIELLEMHDLSKANIIIHNFNRHLDKKLSPSFVREEYSRETYGHPHQELDGYAHFPSKLLNSLDHNITYVELKSSLSRVINGVGEIVGHMSRSSVETPGMVIQDSSKDGGLSGSKHQDSVVESKTVSFSKSPNKVEDFNPGDFSSHPIQTEEKRGIPGLEVKIEGEEAAKQTCCRSLFDICK